MRRNVENQLEELRSEYRSSLPAKLAKLESMMPRLEKDVSTFPEFYRSVHSLKGTSGTYGLKRFSRACQELEDELLKQESKQVFQLHHLQELILRLYEQISD